MPKTRQQKADVIDRLEREFKGAKSAVFADFQGVTVAKADGPASAGIASGTIGYACSQIPDLDIRDRL